MSLVVCTVALTFTISTQRTALDNSTGLLPYQICGSLICILQSAVTFRSLQPLTSKALRTESTGENCIRPQLHDLVFYTSTFHPSPVPSLEGYYPLPSVSHPSQSCRYQQVFYFYCQNELISKKKSNSELEPVPWFSFVCQAPFKCTSLGSLLQPRLCCRDSITDTGLAKMCRLNMGR